MSAATSFYYVFLYFRGWKLFTSPEYDLGAANGKHLKRPTLGLKLEEGEGLTSVVWLSSPLPQQSQLSPLCQGVPVDDSSASNFLISGSQPNKCDPVTTSCYNCSPIVQLSHSGQCSTSLSKLVLQLAKPLRWTFSPRICSAL